MIWIAPTEPDPLKALGQVSILPEKFGVDVFWLERGERWGVQRKEVADLRASVDDGRLGKELAQIKSAGVCGVLAIEGRVNFNPDGIMLKRYGRVWTREQWWAVQLAAQQEGVWLAHTNNLQETIAFVEMFHKWSQKETHGSLACRPAPKGIWGTTAKDKDWGVHVLTSLPGIGVELAKRIWDEFDGLPWAWKVTRDELLNVKGMGKKKVDAVWGLFDGSV